jgi:hypothetical protein
MSLEMSMAESEAILSHSFHMRTEPVRPTLRTTLYGLQFHNQNSDKLRLPPAASDGDAGE